jgi:16S rRNA (cytosine967-C5)-methyltransferase
VAAAALRRQGELELVLKSFLERPLPADKGRLWPILLAGAAQLVCLGMPPHAVVDLAVETTRRDRGAHRFAKLVNAVLRRVAERGADILAGQDGVRLNIPDWLWQRWTATYGAETARRIAEAALREAPLDISVKPDADAAAWAARARRTAPRHRIDPLAAHGRIEDLPGSPTARGGCRTPLPRWWRDWRATSGARPSPTFARRPAARRRCSPPPERR